MRADVIEELTGHLVEPDGSPRRERRARSRCRQGRHRRFRRDRRPGDRVSGAFHSRLWASTIGVLLPAIAMPGDRPGVIGWLRLALGIGVLITVLALGAVVWRGTPGHLLIAVAGLGSDLGLVLAFQALGRGQRWALWFAIGFAVELVVFGVISVVAASPGTTTIPIGAVLGVGVLLGAHSAWERLRSFTAGSAPIARPLQALLGMSFVVPLLVVPVMATIPDPTQATADDLRLLVSVTCDRGEVIEPGFPSRPDVQRVRIVADMEWRRGDFFPAGLDGFFNPTGYGDTAGFRLDVESMGEAIPHWLLVPRIQRSWTLSRASPPAGSDRRRRAWESSRTRSAALRSASSPRRFAVGAPSAPSGSSRHPPTARRRGRPSRSPTRISIDS